MQLCLKNNQNIKWILIVVVICIYLICCEEKETIEFLAGLLVAAGDILAFLSVGNILEL